MNSDVRAIAALKRVTGITPIPDADRIEAAHVGGWTVVVAKGEFAVGEQVVYFEIDAALPLDDPRFAFLAPRGTKTVEGREVHVLKTARLRGVYSQGLLAKVAAFEQELAASGALDDPSTDAFHTFAEQIGVVKYEPPLPGGSDIIGAWDSRICPKTDAERIQNVDWDPAWTGLEWTATEKIDGTSTTFDVGVDGVRVFSRNYQIAPAPGDARTRLAEQIAAQVPPGFTLQGELYGEGIGGNRLKVTGVHYAVFGVFLRGEPVRSGDWPEWAAERRVPAVPELPVLADAAAMVEAVDGLRSVINPKVLAEGVVYARADAVPMDALGGRACFKVISNRWLLKS